MHAGEIVEEAPAEPDADPGGVAASAGTAPQATPGTEPPAPRALATGPERRSRTDSGIAQSDDDQAGAEQASGETKEVH